MTLILNGNSFSIEWKRSSRPREKRITRLFLTRLEFMLTNWGCRIKLSGLRSTTRKDNKLPWTSISAYLIKPWMMVSQDWEDLKSATCQSTHKFARLYSMAYVITLHSRNLSWVKVASITAITLTPSSMPFKTINTLLLPLLISVTTITPLMRMSSGMKISWMLS